jgi:hypothetical protein
VARFSYPSKGLYTIMANYRDGEKMMGRYVLHGNISIYFRGKSIVFQDGNEYLIFPMEKTIVSFENLYSEELDPMEERDFLEILSYLIKYEVPKKEIENLVSQLSFYKRCYLIFCLLNYWVDYIPKESKSYERDFSLKLLARTDSLEIYISHYDRLWGVYKPNPHIVIKLLRDDLKYKPLDDDYINRLDEIFPKQLEAKHIFRGYYYVDDRKVILNFEKPYKLVDNVVILRDAGNIANIAMKLIEEKAKRYMSHGWASHFAINVASLFDPRRPNKSSQPPIDVQYKIAKHILENRFEVKPEVQIYVGSFSSTLAEWWGEFEVIYGQVSDEIVKVEEGERPDFRYEYHLLKPKTDFAIVREYGFEDSSDRTGNYSRLWILFNPKK